MMSSRKSNIMQVTISSSKEIKANSSILFLMAILLLRKYKIKTNSPKWSISTEKEIILEN